MKYWSELIVTIAVFAIISTSIMILIITFHFLSNFYISYLSLIVLKMARGHQKFQSQQKNAQKMEKLKKSQGHDQKSAARKALIFTCTVCKVIAVLWSSLCGSFMWKQGWGSGEGNCPPLEQFKWLSKVITWLRLLRLVIGLKDLRQFFNQWEAPPTNRTLYAWFLQRFEQVTGNC